jgi:hypothetical protein
MNRHAPHSAISNPPRTHHVCAACRNPIQVQHRRIQHECSELCHPHGVTHDYQHETLAPLTRYFNAGMGEICVGCAAKQAIRDHHELYGGIKAGDVIQLSDTIIEVVGHDAESNQLQLQVRQQ